MNQEIEQKPITDIYRNQLREGFYLYSSEPYRVNKGVIFLSFNEKGELAREWSDGYKETSDLHYQGSSSYEPLLTDSVKAKMNCIIKELKWFESKLEELAKKQTQQT